MPLVTLAPAQHFDFSAGSFHSWNTEAEKRRSLHQMVQAKGVRRGGAGPQDF